MLFKSLRRRSASSKESKLSAPNMALEKITSTSSSNPRSTPLFTPPPKESREVHEAGKEGMAVLSTMTTGECRDYEEFLEKARREEVREEERKKEVLRMAIRDADKRRRNADMDPWSRRF